jgi:hypothetical protein
VSETVIETMFSLDGRNRVEIYRRGDGLFGYRQYAYYDRPEPEGRYWTPEGHWGTITDTAETALREARTSAQWMRDQE